MWDGGRCANDAHSGVQLPERVPRKDRLVTLGVKHLTSLVAHGLTEIEVVASTTSMPKSPYSERVPRKDHLATLGLKYLTSLVGHGLTEIEAAASTTSTPNSDCPL